MLASHVVESYASSGTDKLTFDVNRPAECTIVALPLFQFNTPPVARNRSENRFVAEPRTMPSSVTGAKVPAVRVTVESFINLPVVEL